MTVSLAVMIRGQSRAILFAALLLLMRTGSSTASELLPVIVNTGGALAVACEGNLSFGTVGIAGGNQAGSVTVATSASPSAFAIGSGITVTGAFRPALCTVTDVVSTGGASVALSGPSGNDGTFSGGTLSGVLLRNGGDSIGLSLTVDKTLVPITGGSGTGTPIYIGGTVTIPANEIRRGVFSETFTITVTE